MQVCECVKMHADNPSFSCFSSVTESYLRTDIKKDKSLNEISGLFDDEGITRILKYKTVYKKNIAGEVETNLNEIIDPEKKIKLFIEIKKKGDIKNNYECSHINSIIKVAMTEINKKLVEYIDYVPSIIQINYSEDDNICSRLVYTNVVFENISDMIKFIIETDSLVIDKSIYMKKSINIIKKFPDEFIKCYNYDRDEKKDKYFFYDTLLHCRTNKKTPIDISQNDVYFTNIVSPIIDDVIYLKKRTDTKTLCKLVKMMNSKRVETMTELMKIGSLIKYENYCAIRAWKKLCKKSEYKISDFEIYYKWNKFTYILPLEINPLTILKSYAKNDSPTKFFKAFREKINEEEDYIVKPISVCTEYLIGLNEKIKDVASVVTKNIDKWLSDEIKTLCIKSPYNTGKTSIIKKIIGEYMEDTISILFMTHRKTLSLDVEHTFEECGFVNYMAHGYKCDRLICQLDSLKNIPLNKGEDFKYDFVIVDESESILNHFSAKTLADREYTFNIFQKIIERANKVLVLDGDLSNRSLSYFSKNKIIFIENTFKKDIKHFDFVNDIEKFKELIDKDLKDGKKIVFVSMSSEQATAMNDKYKDKYKTMLHTRLTTNTDLYSLYNIEKTWKVDLLCYTPAVEAGVNFDVEHFDKIYAYACVLSTSQRSFLQMINRIRKVKDNRITIHTPFKVTDNFEKNLHTYTEVYEQKKYILRCWNQYFLNSRELEEKNMMSRMNSELFKIYVYNSVEELNKNPSVFVYYLLQMLKSKGHTYTVQEKDSAENSGDIKLIKKKEEKIKLIPAFISKAPSITNKEFLEINDRYMKNIATCSDKLKREKYIFMNIWKIEDIKLPGEISDKKKTMESNELEKFIEENYYNTRILENLRLLLFEKRITAEIHDYEKNSAKIMRLELIKEIIEKTGFDIHDKTIIMKRDVLGQNLKNMLSDSKLFKNYDFYCKLFHKRPLKISDKIKQKNLSFKNTLGIIQGFLSVFGMRIKKKRKSVWVREKKSRISTFTNTLIIDEKYNDFL